MSDGLTGRTFLWQLEGRSHRPISTKPGSMKKTTWSDPYPEDFSLMHLHPLARGWFSSGVTYESRGNHHRGSRKSLEINYFQVMSIPRSEALRFSKLFTSVYFDRSNNWTASVSVLCLSWTQVDSIRKSPINVGLSRRVKKKRGHRNMGSNFPEDQATQLRPRERIGLVIGPDEKRCCVEPP